jgi:VWFA-related protein
MWSSLARLRPLCGPAVLLICFALAPVAAQQEQPPPTFRSGVEVVRIDVSVVDRDGRPVNDLTAGDFTVTVDRKPRTIVSAQFLDHDSRIARTTGRRAAAGPPPSSPPQAPPPPPQAAPPPRIVLVVIDEDSIAPVEGLLVRREVARFLDLLASNDRVGVTTIPRLREEVTLSTRRSDVLKLLNAVTTGGPVDLYEFSIGLAEAFAIERGEADVAQRVVKRECPTGESECGTRVMMQARRMALQAHLRGQRSLDALAGIAEGLAAVEGPKTLLLVSGGMPMPDLHSLAAFDKIESSFAAAQISLYTLYMARSSFGQVRNKPSPTAVEDDNLEAYGIENATSVTGGTLMLGIGTLDQYFDRIVTELSGSYLLGVEVTPADRDGRTHRVEVNVNRRGVGVRARKRYLIEEPRAVQPAAPTLENARAPKGRTAKETAPAQVRAPTSLTLDLVALDRDGRFVDSLRPGALAVTVNGRPRRVLSMRHVSRGPGAFASASLQAAAGGQVEAAAEDSRTVLVVIDEAMLEPANAEVVRKAAGSFIDELGPNDRVAVVRIPQPETSLTFTTERPALRDALRAIGANGPAPDDRFAPDGDLERTRLTLYGLETLFGRLGEIPGRKAVALISAGLPAQWLRAASQVAAPERRRLTVEAVAQLAGESRIAVYGIGVRQRPPKGRPQPDLAPVEAIARQTGGQYSTTDLLEKSLRRFVSALSACYVLEVEEEEQSPGGQPSGVEVKTSRKDVTLEAAAWIVSGHPPDDRLVAAVGPGSGAAAVPDDADLRLILPRLAEYVAAYRRQFSAYVAEENYQQSARGQNRRILRSDLLLLAADAGRDWVQFRDVFEVDGQKVRDREDRLKKLFLENSAEGLRQMEAIRNESARFNVGEIQRNQNVPFYPLIFATAENMPRFTFKVAKKTTIGGLTAWRVEYAERARPTIIRNPRNEDVPVHGAFTVECATGAVLATEMVAEDTDMRGSVSVRYRRDDGQGLWLPAEMSEYYSERATSVRPGYGAVSPGWAEAHATYSNFRRFRVTTDTEFKGRKSPTGG